MANDCFKEAFGDVLDRMVSGKKPDEKSKIVQEMRELVDAEVAGLNHEGVLEESIGLLASDYKRAKVKDAEITAMAKDMSYKGTDAKDVIGSIRDSVNGRGRSVETNISSYRERVVGKLEDGMDDEDEDGGVQNLEAFLREFRYFNTKIRDYFDDIDLGLCDCGGQPYVDRCPIAGPIPYWVACNCGKTGVSELDRDKAMENWKNNILEDKENLD